MKKIGIMMLLLTMSIVVSGCETLKGTAKGFKTDVDNLTSEEHGIPTKMHKMDQWTRDNMW